MADAKEQTEATKKRLADEKAQREKASAERQKAMSGVKPTPTQAENDLSASGEHVIEHEHDGSPYEDDVVQDKTKTRAMESKPSGDYQTRAATPTPAPAQPPHK
jgi:hypothetical protein